jgi:hypothetical protein
MAGTEKSEQRAGLRLDFEPITELAVLAGYGNISAGPDCTEGRQE